MGIESVNFSSLVRQSNLFGYVKDSDGRVKATMTTGLYVRHIY